MPSSWPVRLDHQKCLRKLVWQLMASPVQLYGAFLRQSAIAHDVRGKDRGGVSLHWSRLLRVAQHREYRWSFAYLNGSKQRKPKTLIEPDIAYQGRDGGAGRGAEGAAGSWARPQSEAGS